MNIQELRTKIDKIDAEILHLLDDRMEFVHEIGKLKMHLMKVFIDQKEKKKLLKD